jgi:hypothetical protein
LSGGFARRVFFLLYKGGKRTCNSSQPAQPLFLSFIHTRHEIMGINHDAYFLHHLQTSSAV